MRVPSLLLLAATMACAQFKSTAPLVVSPVTVTDARGRMINGLTASDLVVYDNSVPQKVQLEVEDQPVSLAVLIQVSPNASAVLDKLGGSASLLTDLLAAYQGETAILTFSDTVDLAQDFTADSAKLKKVLKYLRPKRQGGALYDGLYQAIHLLDKRDSSRRRILLAIAQTQDSGSKTKLDALLRDPALQNTLIYWLTYSTFLTPFTNKTKTKWDRMTDEEKNDPRRMQDGYRSKFPLPEEEEGLPPDTAPGSLFNIFTSLARQTKVDAASLLSRTTGGRTWSFLKQSALEDAVHAAADEAHQQYIVSFEPQPDEPGLFHTLRAEVKGAAGAKSKDSDRLLERSLAVAASGYWRS